MTHVRGVAFVDATAIVLIQNRRTKMGNMGNGTRHPVTTVSVGQNDEPDAVRVGVEKVYVYKRSAGIRVGCHFITNEAFELIRRIFDKGTS
jgi:hypothetical protein